ncbi:unnamed protein product [Euphydryas editha]|uniref:Peptidase S1 domain-containing protein n=1 Tax=Euphydryas editha TaxID=104508 RepID=A0AAU9TX37_EUPED|nr:unnamed protein product [Euphydryas editha]
MLLYTFIVVLVSKTVLSQMNGEFWWLHDKFAKLQQVEPPQPQFDDVDEFETDESAKIIFKYNESPLGEILDLNENEKILVNEDTKLSSIYFRDQTELSNPANVDLNRNLLNSKNRMNLTTLNFKENNITTSAFKKENLLPRNKTKNDGDELVFVFPERNEIVWKDKKNYIENSLTHKKEFNKNNSITTPKTIVNNKVWFEEEPKQSESESICTFITQEECIYKNGIVHPPGSCPKYTVSSTQKICCVLPLKSNVISSTKVSQSKKYYDFIKRYKRSDTNEKLNAALKQRNALLERNHNLQIQSSKLTATTVRSKPTQKIVTPEYVDPYSNIKNIKFRNIGSQSSINTDYQNTKYDYGNQDYVEDYASELPKPGLVGLYSDHESQGETSWKLKDTDKGIYYGDTETVSEEESDVPFGYSTFDPRLGNRASTHSFKPIRRKPQRLMTTKGNDDDMKNSGSHTISFHSTPDFHVLQGFKLINLAGNKNRYVRKTTTERFYDNNEDSSFDSPSVLTEEDYFDGIDLNQQVYKNCGKDAKKPGKDATEGGCDPWLALVVLTKSTQSILCYATIVHPRAAITAADCVHGKAPGDITIISGVWDLRAEKENSQSRMATVFIHPQFNPGDLSDDLALLHWKRPLTLNKNAQPACLADPHVGDDCYFVGWSGYDQALQQHPRWQQATILTPRSCNEKVSAPDVDLPAGAFCASVETRGTVTGIGGPLLCKSGDRVSIVGVAVYRENVVALLPAFDWVITALRELRIN